MSTFAREARADAPVLDVANGVSGCPSAAELRSAIVARLGSDELDRPNAPHVVRIETASRRESDESAEQGEVTKTATVTLSTRGSSPSSRVLRGSSCDDLVHAAALSVALAVEEEKARPSEPPPAPPPPPSPPAEVDRALDGQAPITRDRAIFAASAQSSVGLLPRASVGAGASVRVRVAERTWLSARGEFLPDASMPGDEFSMHLFGGGAGACVEPLATSSTAVIGCVHVLGGDLRTSGATNPGGALFIASGLSAGARTRVTGPLFVEGSAEAVIPFTRPTFLTETGPAMGFQQHFATLLLSLGVGVSIR